jgi:hypothetical protein
MFLECALNSQTQTKFSCILTSSSQRKLDLSGEEECQMLLFRSKLLEASRPSLRIQDQNFLREQKPHFCMWLLMSRPCVSCAHAKCKLTRECFRYTVLLIILHSYESLRKENIVLSINTSELKIFCPF